MGMLIRDPFNQMSVMRNKMNELFDDFAPFNDFFGHGLPSWGGSVSMDVIDNGKDYLVKANLPGLDPKNLDVHVAEDGLTIKGEYCTDQKGDNKNYMLRERRCGSFVRSIPFNELVVPDQSKASYRDGVLEITVPKSTATKDKSVRLQIEQ